MGKYFLILSLLNNFIGSGWLRNIINMFIQKQIDSEQDSKIYYKDV